MSSQGTFDPNGYVPGNVATYPQPSSGTVYAPGMWWDVDPAGVFGGDPVDVGDRIYVSGVGRRFGDADYGDAVFGGPPFQWSPDNVVFHVWTSTLPPYLTDPFPYAGCPFGADHPGWRFVVDAFYNADDGSRTYGADGYGDDVYGDANGRGVLAWHDVTSGNFSATITVGTETGDPSVDVEQIVLEFTDPTGARFDVAQPASWYLPGVGDTIRVGVADPTLQYHSLAVGEIERILDDHDRLPRLITIEAFGFVMDLVNTVSDWQAHPNPIQTTVETLLAAASWRWGAPVPDYPGVNGPPLLGDADPGDVRARDRLDLIALSAGWQYDTDRRGSLRFRKWPLMPAGATIDVADCREATTPPAALIASTLRIVADYSAMLNVAQTTNVVGAFSEAIDGESTGRHGRRSENFGFPMTDLYTRATEMQALVDRYAAELGGAVVHLEGIDVDSRVDDWLPVLADLDTGRPADVYRAHPSPLTLAGVVVGYEHRLTPNRWQASIYTRTTTPTTRGAP